MKYFFALVFLISFGFASLAQPARQTGKKDPAQKVRLVDIACGQCQFHLKGKGCALAVKIDGKAYFVDGAGIDSFGDAHDKDGFCNKVSRAEVQGKVMKGRFRATYVRLVGK